MMRRFLGFLLLLPAQALAQDPAPADTNWHVSITVDPITDQQQGSAWLLSTDGRSRLAIACNGLAEPTMSIQYRANGYLGSSSGVVLVRINQGSVLPAAGWLLQQRVAYTVDEDWIAGFGAQLGEAETEIVVRALDYHDQPHDGIFRSTNGAAAFRAISDACSRPAPSD